MIDTHNDGYTQSETFNAGSEEKLGLHRTMQMMYWIEKTRQIIGEFKRAEGMFDDCYKGN